LQYETNKKHKRQVHRFYPHEIQERLKLLNTIAVGLIILSGILFGMIFVVPFLPLSLTQKGISVTVLVIGMEITWWAAVAIVGKQVISKYGKYLVPRRWRIENSEKEKKSSSL
jgi:ABC-type nickel/cobalt efflux system permease component RcnA